MPRGLVVDFVKGLAEVLTKPFVHFKHGEMGLAEKSLHLGICLDHGLFFFVLKAVPLNVGPQFLHDLGAGKGAGADDSGKLVIQLPRLHEHSIRFSSHNGFI